MTPDEIATLQEIGKDWVQGFVAIVNESVLLTVYAALVIQAGLVLLSKERRQFTACVLSMAAILTMFAIDLVLWSLDLTIFIVEGKMTLIENPGDPIDDKYGRALTFIFRMVSAQDALYAYLSLIGDAIIIYRVWGLKAYSHLWVFSVPCALLVGSFMSTILLTYCVGSVGSDIVLGNFEKPAFCKNIQLVSYVMPMVTTAVSTILIGIKAWKYRREIKPLYTRSTTSTGSGYGRSEKIFVLLVESGFFYFFFFLVQVIKLAPMVDKWVDSNTTMTFLFKMYDYCSSVIVGMYPTLIIVLAHSKFAVIDKVTTMAISSNTASGLRSTTWPNIHVDVETRRDEIELSAGLDSHGMGKDHGQDVKHLAEGI